MTRDPINWNERYETKDTPWDSGEASGELQRLLKEGHIKPCRMLEIGCGTGTNAVFLAQSGFDVTAIDLSPLAIEQAKAKASRAKANIQFKVADILRSPDLGKPYDLVFDRGVYHGIRTVDLFGFLKALEQLTKPGSLYVTLAGNANEVRPPGQEEGPPQVHAHELSKELWLLFDLVQLREFHFDGVVVEGRPIRPLGWSAVLRRR